MEILYCFLSSIYFSNIYNIHSLYIHYIPLFSFPPPFILLYIQRERGGGIQIFFLRKEREEVCGCVCVCSLPKPHTREKRERVRVTLGENGYINRHTHTTLPTSLDLKYLVSLSLSETPCMYIYLRSVTPTSIHIYKL